MRKSGLLIHAICLMVCLILTLSYYPAYGAKTPKKDKPISSGEILPKITLAGPDSEEVQKYLGLKNTEPFSISQIPAKLILIEILNVL